MTDLERALLAAYRDAWEALIPNGPSHQVMFGIKIAPIVDAALAAARREGAEAERVSTYVWAFRAAEEMRERAAQTARNACLVPPDGGSPTEEERLVCEEAERRIRALPLTPEDPA